LAAVVVVVVLVTSGGGGSSGWSSGDVAKAESALANKLTEEGLTPTKSETECLVKGLEPIVSASELLSNAPNDSTQKKDEVEQVTRDCVSGSSSSSSSSISGETEEIYGEAEETLSGPACQEDVSSSACQEEATEKEDQIAEKEGLTPPEE